MVGMLGCGCCGNQSTVDSPIYYGLCDCGNDSQVIRGDYLQPWDEPIPSLPLFYRPGGNPRSVPYTEWIYESRFHMTCKASWNNESQAPYWSCFEQQSTSFLSAPYGVAGVSSQFNSQPSRFKSQFCWNEFDYEISFDVRFDSKCKPSFVPSGVLNLGLPAQLATAQHQITYSFASSDFNLPFHNDLEFLSVSYYDSAPGSYVPVKSSQLQLRDGGSAWNIFGGKPPIQILEYDRTYNVKQRFTTPPLSPTSHGVLTIDSFIDSQKVTSYTGYSTFRFATWTNCTTTSPPVSRLLTCSEINFKGFVDGWSFFNSNPARSVWVDNFKFDAIPK